jgi:N-acetylmuramate 1-kinase
MLSWSERRCTITDTMSERLDQAREWVQHTLGAASVDLQPASSDASFRRYFRVRSQDTSMILMDAPPDREDCGPYLAVGALLEQSGVHVPAVYAQDLTRGFLLLEDLGQRSYLDELDDDSANGLYADALDTLINMQLRIPPGSVPEYDDSLVARELCLFNDWFLQKHLGIDTSGTSGGVLSKSFELLAAGFREQARVFVHRDYHSRNLMRTDAHNPGVLDFQDAVHGPAVYDVISLLRDVYVEWPRERVQDWLLGYHHDAHARGVPINADGGAFLRDADLVAAQRHLKIAGIFCRLYYRDGKPDYLHDIALTLRYLLDECEGQEELRPLATLLQDWNVMERLTVRNDKCLDTSAGRSP